MKSQYVKVRFSSFRYGSTAGLIVEAGKLSRMTVGDVSRMFPRHEALKMERYESSPIYDSFDDAFAHEFPAASFVRSSVIMSATANR